MTTGLGASIGGLIGFIIGGIIPSEGEIVLSFFSRITGNAILTDPVGLFMSLSYVIIAMSVCGLIGGLIGSIFNSFGERY